MWGSEENKNHEHGAGVQADSLFYMGSQRTSLLTGKSLNTAAQLIGTSASTQVNIPEESMKSHLDGTWSKLIFYQIYARKGALSEQFGIDYWT